MEEESFGVKNKSPNYEQQEEEIEVLKNILPEKVIILKSEPNFQIQIEIEGDNPEQEESFKTFYLEIFLNHNYPEKAPRVKVYEINDCINEKRQEMLMKKLDEYCKENEGISMIYQLYEIVKEFADEEEKIFLMNKKYEEMGKIKYKFNSSNKVKQLTTSFSYPIDIFEIKDQNILVVFRSGIIQIYDSHLETLMFELLQRHTYSPIIFCRYFDFSYNNSMIYLFEENSCYVFKIIYLSKKTIAENDNYKINGKIKVEFFHNVKTYDVIEFPQYPDSFFYLSKLNKKILLYKSNKSYIYEEEISKNKFFQNFRRLYYINPKKFISASYTLKKQSGENISITGINKLCLVETKNFTITKTFDIKLSPLGNSIATFKDKYLIISYFNIIQEGDNLEDYNYNRNVYSYDIKQHCIGIFSIQYEEFVTKIEYNLIKRMYNINDHLLCLYVNQKKSFSDAIITYENIFYEYHNYSRFKDEDDKIEQYLAYLSFDTDIKTSDSTLDFDDITSFKEIGKKYLAICSKKKGILLYS